MAAAVANSGVWGHSSFAAYDDFIVFAIDENVDTEKFLRVSAERGAGVKQLQGCYKGKQETSFIVSAANWRHVAAFTVGQESILVLGPMKNKGGGKMARPARLQFGNGLPDIDLGFFVERGEAFAKAQDGWTFDPTTGKYWVCL